MHQVPTFTKEALAGPRRLVRCMMKLVTENDMIGSPASSNLHTYMENMAQRCEDLARCGRKVKTLTGWVAQLHVP